MVVPYSEFGIQSPCLYRQYLLTCVAGHEQVDRSVFGGVRGGRRKLGGGDLRSVAGVGDQVAVVTEQRRRWLEGGGYGELLQFFGEDSVGGGRRGAECGCKKSSGEPDANEGSSSAGFSGAADARQDGVRGEFRSVGVDARDDSGGSDRVDDVERGSVPAATVGKHNSRNRAKREKMKRIKKEKSWRSDSGVGNCSSGPSVAGSVHTVDTRTGVEIEAAQTLAARRVAENKLAVKKAEADRLLVEHRIRALQDKSRTKAVEKLAATRMEEKINKSKKNSEEAFKQCEASLKSLGSTGSAGEFALKQQIKDARDNEAILKYVQEQNKIYARNATPEVLNAVSRVKAPVVQEEYDAFGDCPSDYDEDEAEAYNNDRNRRNDEMAQRLQGLDEAPLW